MLIAWTGHDARKSLPELEQSQRMAATVQELPEDKINVPQSGLDSGCPAEEAVGMSGQAGPISQEMIAVTRVKS